MKNIKDFFTKLVGKIFTALDEFQSVASPPAPLEPAKTYSPSEMKAGYIHLRNRLSGSHNAAAQDDYNLCIVPLRTQGDMTRDDIAQEMDRLIDLMHDNNLISDDAMNMRSTLKNSLTSMVIQGMDDVSFEEKLLNSIRYDQQLSKPKLRVINGDLDM